MPGTKLFLELEIAGLVAFDLKLLEQLPDAFNQKRRLAEVLLDLGLDWRNEPGLIHPLPDIRHGQLGEGFRVWFQAGVLSQADERGRSPCWGNLIVQQATKGSKE